MLTSEQIEKITLEVMLNRKPTIISKEADEFREKLQKDIDYAKKMGWQIEIPFEMLNDDLD